jgi:ribonucleoside-triphosphate reductase
MVRTKTEVYSRIVGYIRPVSNWNCGKEAEFHERKMFNVEEKQVNEKEKDNKPS